MILPRNAVTLAGVFATLLVLTPTSGAQQPELLYLSGSPGPSGVGFDRFIQFVVNESGSHFLNAPVVVREVERNAISRDGHIVLLEGQPLEFPAGSTFHAAVGTISMNRAGDLAWALDVDGLVTSLDDRFLAWNGRMLARQGSPVLSNHVGGNPFTPGTSYKRFDATDLNSRGEILVLGTLDDTGFKGQESYASLLTVDAEGRLLTEDFLAVRRYPLGSTGETVEAVGTNPHSWALNNQGDWIGLVQASGSNLVIQSGQVVLRTGQESPAHPGRNVVAISNLGMNNQGDFVLSTILDGNPYDDTALVMNRTDVLVTEGDSFPAISPHRISRFDGAPIRVCDDGAVFWYANTSDSPGQSRRYFRSTRDGSGVWTHQVLVQQGVTTVGDTPVLDLRTSGSAFDVSDDGRFWIGQVLLPPSRVSHVDHEALLSIDFTAQR